MRGLYGGSFNPPHVGHLAVAQACAEAGALRSVVWMPAATPPHKQGDPALAPARARLAMVAAAVEGNPLFSVSDSEIRRADDQPSYTVHTVRALTAGGDAWALIVGGDSLAGFAGWHRPREILDHVGLLVYRRPGADLGFVPDWVLDRTTFVDGPALDVSSTEVRAQIASGRSARYLVPDAVRGLIRARGLYGADGSGADGSGADESGG